MNNSRRKPSKPRRRAASAGLILLLPAVVGLAVLAADVGYVTLVRSQLQVAADSSVTRAAAKLAMSRRSVVLAARQDAIRHAVSGGQVTAGDVDVEMGRWDADSRTFVASAIKGNAVRVTTRSGEAGNPTRIPLPVRLFNSIFFDLSASAVAATSPRDIVFVVDLSGSMNDDSEPFRAGNAGRDAVSDDRDTAIGDSETTAASGFRMSRSMQMQQIFDDFGFGSYPGELESIGHFAGVAGDQHAYAQLTSRDGPMAGNQLPEPYRIQDDDDELQRKRKCYSALIDLRIAHIMPAAKPTPDSRTHYEYWEKYLDYVIAADKVLQQRLPGSRPAGGPSVNRGWLPPHQDQDRIDSFANSTANPSTGVSADRTLTSEAPGTDATDLEPWRHQIGYLTYLQFLLDFGRDLKPDGRRYVPLSRHSPDCPWHEELTAGGTFDFPPRTQPMHSVRRSLIAVLATIARHNAGISDPQQADRVAIVTFDSLTGGGPAIEQPLTANYHQAMRTCARLQAVSDRGPSRATGSGLEMAMSHLRCKKEGGRGRRAAKKLLVLVTAGLPDVYSVDSSKIDRFISTHSSSGFYGNHAYHLNAPLMLASQMRARHWHVFPVGVGLKSNDEFLARLARASGSAGENGRWTRTSIDPGRHQERLTQIFQEIVSSPRVRIVQ